MCGKAFPRRGKVPRNGADEVEFGESSAPPGGKRMQSGGIAAPPERIRVWLCFPLISRHAAAASPQWEALHKKRRFRAALPPFSSPTTKTTVRPGLARSRRWFSVSKKSGKRPFSPNIPVCRPSASAAAPSGRTPPATRRRPAAFPRPAGCADSRPSSRWSSPAAAPA